MDSEIKSDNNASLADRADRTLVTVDSFFSPNDAHMARLKLENEGILVFLDNEHLVAANQLYGPATGGIKLRVPADQAQEAVAILSPRPIRACPACSSHNIACKPMPKSLFLLSLLLLTIPLWLLPHTWECQDCKHIWRAR